MKVKLGRCGFYVLMGLCMLTYLGCGKGGSSSDTAKITVKVVLAAVPQREGWDATFDNMTIKGKLKGSEKTGEAKKKFRVKEDINLKEVRGQGFSMTKDNLAPGEWTISLKYMRGANLLELNKGLGKETVKLEAGKETKLYFTYTSKNGFTKVSEKEAKDEEKEFFLHGQSKYKERVPPPEPEPDYEAEGY